MKTLLNWKTIITSLTLFSVTIFSFSFETSKNNFIPQNFFEINSNEDFTVYENNGSSEKEITITAFNTHKHISWNDIIQDTIQNIGNHWMYTFQDGMFRTESKANEILDRHWILNKESKTFTTLVPQNGKIIINHSGIDPDGKFFYKVIDCK